eukprot:1364172-Rhodomonas_salina.6
MGGVIHLHARQEPCRLEFPSSEAGLRPRVDLGTDMVAVWERDMCGETGQEGRGHEEKPASGDQCNPRSLTAEQRGRARSEDSVPRM